MSSFGSSARLRNRDPARGAALGAALAALLAGAPSTSPAAAAAAPGGAVVGRQAPPFLLERPGGGEYTRASFPRRPMVLNVYASWCASCRLEERALVAAYRSYGKRVTFLGIDEQEAEKTALRYAHELGVTYPVALDDGQFAATYGTAEIPETVFVDGRGIVRAIRLGGMSPAELTSALATIVSARGGTT